MRSQESGDVHLITESLEMLRTMREVEEKYLSEEEKAQARSRLERTVGDLCEVELDLVAHSKAVEDTTTQIAEDDDTNMNSIEESYQNNLKKYESNAKIGQNHQYFTIVFQNSDDSAVLEVQRETEREVEYEEVEGGDDSIIFSNTFSIPIDPISKTEITEPYKNRKCGHVYENGFIQQYIKKQKTKARCPYIGCNNKGLTLRDLVKDSSLKQKIQEFKKSI